jgi:ElaB/YqjD/DUF883 family membrane-anchored ribosome-binding protein
MFGQRAQANLRSSTVREMDNRLRSIERGLQRAGNGVAVKASDSSDHLSAAIVSALGSLAERFRGVSIGDEAARFGEDAAKFGNDTLRRLSKEVEHRPLVTLAIAGGVGLLLGLVVLRRS